MAKARLEKDWKAEEKLLYPYDDISLKATIINNTWITADEFSDLFVEFVESLGLETVSFIEEIKED